VLRCLEDGAWRRYVAQLPHPEDLVDAALDADRADDVERMARLGIAN
jgi:hypothetical protein